MSTGVLSKSNAQEEKKVRCTCIGVEKGLYVDLQLQHLKLQKTRYNLRLIRIREESACATGLNYSPSNTRPETTPSYHIPTRKKSGHSHVNQILTGLLFDYGYLLVNLAI